jgi:hypothetical protein
MQANFEADGSKTILAHIRYFMEVPLSLHAQTSPCGVFNSNVVKVDVAIGHVVQCVVVDLHVNSITAQMAAYRGVIIGFLGCAILAIIVYKSRQRYQKSKTTVMISYKHDDLEYAKRIQKALLRLGFKVWIDTAITPGKN